MIKFAIVSQQKHKWLQQVVVYSSFRVVRRLPLFRNFKFVLNFSIIPWYKILRTLDYASTRCFILLKDQISFSISESPLVRGLRERTISLQKNDTSTSAQSNEESSPAKLQTQASTSSEIAPTFAKCNDESSSGPSNLMSSQDEDARRRELALRQHAFFQLRLHIRRGVNLVAMDRCGNFTILNIISLISKWIFIKTHRDCRCENDDILGVIVRVCKEYWMLYYYKQKSTMNKVWWFFRNKVFTKFILQFSEIFEKFD